MSIRFDGKVAVITGAGNGLGKSYALFLASRGARVVVNDLGSATNGEGDSALPAQAVTDEINAAGGAALADFADISQAEGAKDLVNHALDHFGAVDILICNAGILRDRTFAKMPLEDFDALLRVHLYGTIYTAKAAWPFMQERGYGRIVFTTSASGLYGNFGQSNYSTAKLGIVGLMNSLKLEGARYNIHVNTIAPLAASRLAAGTFSDDLQPLLKPEFVTAAVAYLCSQSCQASGEIITAGAGQYARAQMVESRGVAFDPKGSVTPEMIAQQWDAITEMTGAEGFVRSHDAVVKAFRHFLDQ